MRRLKRPRLKKQKVTAFQHLSLPNHPGARVAMLESIGHQKCPPLGSTSTLYVEKLRNCQSAAEQEKCIVVIALSSIFGSILHLIFLNRYSDKLCTSELQFRFKAKRSTNHCSTVLKEDIAYYVNNGSIVYCTMLAYYVNNGSTVTALYLLITSITVALFTALCLLITSITAALFTALCLTPLRLLTGWNIVSCFVYLLVMIYHLPGLGYC